VTVASGRRASSGEGGATRTVVAATKLTIPTTVRPVVPRPELDARLDGDYRLGLVSAPAGYGKTATLAAWARPRRERVAWLSCDPTDAEPNRFMSCLLSAIAARWPGVADDAFVLLERAGANTYDSAVAVANDLAGVGTAGIILIDDLHLAAPNPAMLTAFIEALPPDFRLVAATRSDPPMSLARMRVRGELMELRGEDLRFAAGEMSDFFALHDVTLGDDDLDRLHELTEGWAAGAQLAAIALQGREVPEHFLEAFSSTDHGVGDFLVTEVLAGLPPDLVEFLVETSVLDMFDAELCAIVTGREDAAMVLERLLAADLFLVPLDDRAHWYRYHHLFGAFLRARLASLGINRLRDAHERASRALEERQDVEGALQHALAIDDVELAGRIVRAAISRSASMSEGADVTARAVRLWLHQVGGTYVETDPVWVVEFLIGLISVTGPDDAPAWLERVRRAHPEADAELAALIEGAWSEHHQYRGQPLEAIRRMRRAADAIDRTPHPTGLLSLQHMATARAHIQAGGLDEANAVLSFALARPTGNVLADDVRYPGAAALVAALSGDLSRASALSARAIRTADELGLGHHEPGRILAGMGLVEVHAERMEHDVALHLLDGVTAASDASHRLTLQYLVTMQRARVARQVGDEAAADELLTLAGLQYAEPDKAVRQVLGEERVAQALRFDPSKAASLIAELDQERVTTQVLHARLALTEHDVRTAEAVLADLPPATTLRTRVERDVLCALSVLGRDVERATGHLRDALAAGQPERLMSTIVELGPGVHQLLASFAPSSSEEQYVEMLIAATDRIVAPVRAEPAAALVEPLSSRELTVLRYLCSRLTYREIAAALYVSQNTLKSHVKSVYRKLDVASRADAVDTGRRLGVI
jgi:LuxR family maltose regulon positive regulatory protein